MWVFCLDVYLRIMWVCGAWCLWKLEEGIGFPGAGVIGSLQAAMCVLESYLGPLEGQTGILTTKPSLQPSVCIFKQASK